MKVKYLFFYVSSLLPLVTFAGGSNNIATYHEMTGLVINSNTKPGNTPAYCEAINTLSISRGDITTTYVQGNGGANDHRIIISNKNNTISDKLIESPFIKGNWVCNEASGAQGEIFDHRGEISLSGDYVSFYTKAYEGSFLYYMKISNGNTIVKVENNNIYSIISGGILEALSYQDRGGDTYVIIRNKEEYKELGIGIWNIKSLKKINNTIIVSGIEYTGPDYSDLYRSKISYDITNNKRKRIIKYKFKLLD